MSLTSYRAAPPRGGLIVERDVFLFRFGGDLLSHVLRRSTIGATALNFRVREGIGCFARAVATKPEKKHASGALGRSFLSLMIGDCLAFDGCMACLALLFPYRIKPIGRLVPVD